MSQQPNLTELLTEIDAGLAWVVQALASAELTQVQSAERTLAHLVQSFGAIEAAARLQPGLSIKRPVQRLQDKLVQAGRLNSAALRSLNRAAEMRGVVSPEPTYSLSLEG